MGLCGILDSKSGYLPLAASRPQDEALVTCVFLIRQPLTLIRAENIVHQAIIVTKVAAYYVKLKGSLTI